jgi:cardiolipin synthase
VPGPETDAKPVRAAGQYYYEELLSAGVRIFEFRPAMMHDKLLVVDGIWSVVGSANLDERSMEINEENVVGIADERFAAEIERALEADFERSEEIVLEKWGRRSRLRRVLERLSLALVEQY